MLRKYCIAGLACFVIVLSVKSAQACSCAGGASPCQEYGTASAVFVGMPISVRTFARPVNRDGDDLDNFAPRTFRFSIETSFLGITSPEMEVSTGLGGGDCGYDFKIGKRYVVYAYKSGKAGRLVTSICSRTNPFIIEARSNRPYDGDPRRLGPMERVEPLRVVVSNPT